MLSVGKGRRPQESQIQVTPNIELSRPAVRSPVAAQFTFPIPHCKPAVPGSASTTCYAPSTWKSRVIISRKAHSVRDSYISISFDFLRFLSFGYCFQRSDFSSSFRTHISRSTSPIISATKSFSVNRLLFLKVYARPAESIQSERHSPQ
jgi:hypothetical protein